MALLRGIKNMDLKSKNNIETNKFELEIEASAAEFEAAINTVFRKESKTMNVPGFRKGKAPRAVIENLYGKEVFFEAAVDHLYRDMVQEAVEKSELEVVAVTAFNIETISKEDGVLAKLTAVTKPEVEIKDYKGIAVEKEEATVTDEEIAAEIDRVRERNSRMLTIEDRNVEDGDIVNIDYEGFVDEVPFDGGKAEASDLTIGAGQFIPGFEEQVIGHGIGEEFDITVTFPEEYHAENLKGQEAVFKIKLNSIKKKELPELDNEFVKDVSEFDTLDEYTADVKAHLLEHKEEHIKADMEEQIVEAVISKLEGEIPEEMIENEIDETINSFAYRLQSQGLNLETYLKYTGMTTETLREQHKEQAGKQVKVRLGLEKIAKLEDITANEKEIEDELQKLSEGYGMPLESIKNLVSDSAISADIKNRKTMDFLLENAKITPKKEEKSK